MALKTIDLEATKLTLDELLSQLNATKEILLTRANIPVARLTSADIPTGQEQPLPELYRAQSTVRVASTEKPSGSFWFDGSS